MFLKSIIVLNADIKLNYFPGTMIYIYMLNSMQKWFSVKNYVI